MKYLLIIVFFIAVLTGCTITHKKTISDYPSAIAWNDKLYGSSAEEVPPSNIGKEIGEIKRKKTPRPSQNGDSNDKPVGSLLFEITGKDSKDVIAYKVNDTYFKAYLIGPL
ncbi:hypothetical protein A8709_29755 [Paenibacillus pectinilyticus]|uniref:Lipoprotein n=1 Tax=Paenibacillus pectinilyticus TaxID=512399 RepID=A0A1C0ZVB0_9BACL|nr:hypothetical protein [Paenibacillus pectinilyticus]OCT12041.1 hypothetical protein A8709_29755 [Paenibacillus pectinilyticus]